MLYVEEERDIFTVPDDYYLVHCISDDYAMGAGIAVEFNKRFGIKNKLMSIKSYVPKFAETQGHCIAIDKTFNLVTKNRYWEKPTYDTLTNTLYDLKKLCVSGGQALAEVYHFGPVKKIAMPLIGCGLDKLEWSKVSAIVKEVFADTDIAILVCRK